MTSALRWGWVVSTTPRPLYPQKDPVPIVLEAGWAPGPVWTGAENLSPTRIRSQDRPARSESLYRLSYRGPHTVPHYLIKDTIFEKPLLRIKCVFLFSLQCVSETFLILRRMEHDMIKKCILVFMWSTLHSCQVLKKLEFSQHNFEKLSNINFHENSSSWSRVVPCGPTHGQRDIMKLVDTFRNFS